MKLATYDDGSRDGQLVVVSRDLSQAHFATGIAGRMQQLLDDWNFLSPQLEDLYTALNGGRARHAFAFEPQLCLAPLPRAYQWAEAIAAPQDNAPDAAPVHPRLNQRAGDALFGPMTPARFRGVDEGLRMAPGLAAVTGDVEAGTPPLQALDRVRLLVLVNAWSVGGGAQGHDAGASFGPVALSPDELGEVWRRGRLHASLRLRRGRQVETAEVANAMAADVGRLIAALAVARSLASGCLVGTGSLLPAAALAPDLKHGDRVQIDVHDAAGASLFGTIDQTLRLQNDAAA